MPPIRTNKRPSSVAGIHKSPVGTPKSRSTPRPAKITQGQKQALIDNLQLEITERARKLRAQYALQAQGLRSRIELRVNRIPTALRKVTMGELLQRATEPKIAERKESTATIVVGQRKPTTGSVAAAVVSSKPQANSYSTVARGMKPTSDEFQEEANKENTPDPSNARMPMRKKRAKLAVNNVLSPKSSNTRPPPRPATATGTKRPAPKSGANTSAARKPAPVAAPAKVGRVLRKRN